MCFLRARYSLRQVGFYNFAELIKLNDPSMKTTARKGLPFLLCASLILLPEPKQMNMTETKASSTTLQDDNPLLAPWPGGYGGVPPFDKIKTVHFIPAFEHIRKQKLHAVDEIANNPAAPDFNNTIVPLEKAEWIVDAFEACYDIFSNNLSTPEFQSVETELAPRITALKDEVKQNEKLFSRIEAIYQSDQTGLTAEQRRLVWLHYTNFVRSGAKLGIESKRRLAEINAALANLFTKFQQNVLADEGQYLVLENKSDVAGLPKFLIEAARAEAMEHNLTGKWIITNTRSSIDPFLTYSTNRSLREKAWRMFVNRGDQSNEYNNNQIIPRILALRKERASLLGYKNHADWQLENSMAKTPENAMRLLELVWKPAVQRVREEVSDMQAIADKEQAGIKIAPWDYHFYMEKVRKARYDFDQNEVKPYLQLENLREGLFYVAREVFGLNFIPVQDVPVFHPDVQVWKVEDVKSRTTIGLWYFDPFARKNKRSGAWMESLRDQEKIDKNVITIVTNNSNFIKGKPGEPVLISWDDATTLFHEFGHALHGLSSNVVYPSLSGTNVFADYVEFPSQLLEHWLSTPEIRQKFMTHYKTGEPIPVELVQKIETAATFNQGFSTLEYLASAIADMKAHSLADTDINPDNFEKETLATLGMPDELVMRHRLPHFLHIFSSDDYSAAYYSYLWADVITADAWQAFVEVGNPYDKNVSERLKKYVFSVGNTLDPAESYRLFRGRDPRTEALMKKRGFTGLH